MVKSLSRKSEVFLDTTYALALSASTNDFHRQGVQLANLLEAMGTRLVTTQAVSLLFPQILEAQCLLYRLKAIARQGGMLYPVSYNIV